MKTLVTPRVHVWTRCEYDKLVASGCFDAQHVELIEGQILDTTPMGSLHATAVALTAHALESAFGAGYFARWQMPFGIGELSEPEPDVAIIAGHIRDYVHDHPTTAVLIVEVADTSLDFDRTVKASLYVKAGIADYWVVNLIDRRIEVCRQPVSDPEAPYGFSYRSRQIVQADQHLSPLALPHVSLKAADLLP